MSADEQRRRFSGVWFPSELYLDRDLTATEKMILLEICSLDNGDGCYAKNEYLADFCQCSAATVTRALSHLKDLGYISVESFDGRHRVMRSNWTWVIRQSGHFDESVSSFCGDTLVKMTRHNISINESTSREGLSEIDIVQKPDEPNQTEAEIDEIVDYLNKVASRRFARGVKSTRSKIRSLINSGYGLDDFKRVIDRKVAQWANDPMMSKYIRPKTLFAADNFESYVNEVDVRKGGGDARQQSFDWDQYGDVMPVL